MGQRMIERKCPKCGHFNYYNLERLCAGNDELCSRAAKEEGRSRAS